MTARVLVADDHPMVRSGLCQMLDAGGDFEVVAEAATGDEALRASGRLRPDVVLMDLRMPDLDGVTATAEIRRRYPEVHVLAPKVASRVLDQVRGGAPTALTRREVDVLRLVAAGRRNRDIPHELHIGETTVKSHLLHIYGKLGVDDRTHAVTVALERGILRIEPDT
ncbi:MAG: response regulator transcription factor [Acidimicrobiales bacterium]